ncbi:MAG: NifB/NifX family molybdenum-iron cluster-binding protein [Longimicrobiales bacterium]
MTSETTRLIAIPGTAPSLDAPMESKFGRAALILLVNPETLEFETLENPAREASGGAGIEAAELLSRSGARGLIAEKLGPKAEAALSAAGITFYECMATGTVRDAMERFKAGELAGPSKGGSAPGQREGPEGDVQAEPEGAPEGGRGPGKGRGQGGGGGRGLGGGGRGMRQGRGMGPGDRGTGRGGGRGGGGGRGRGWDGGGSGGGQGRGKG